MYNLASQTLRVLSRHTFRNCRQFSTRLTSEVTEVTKVLSGWDQKLKDSGIDDYDFTIKCLVAHVLKRKFSALPDNFENEFFNEAQAKDFERLCEARCARMPLQHIIGEWDFLNLTLKTAPTVFIPRPDTEEFVLRVIEAYRNEKNVKMLEVGCGSGAMSLAILNSLPQVNATAIERSKAATALSWQNAKSLGLQERFKVYNHTMNDDKYLPDELEKEDFDLIISNPPYVRSSEFQYLKPEVVVYENLNALDGGPDGLRVARLVFDLACRHLRCGGKLWLELGSDHPPLVKTIMNLKYQGRLRYLTSFEDQYKRDRFVKIEKV